MKKLHRSSVFFSMQGLTLPTLLFACCIGLIASLATAHKAIKYQERRVKAQKIARNISWPTKRPAISQESIDLALRKFKIYVPAGVDHPVLDLGLDDRGVTTVYGADNPIEVTIGPGAFASWAILGSTLAHELEVHCRQSFAWIRMLDLLGLDGTIQAERSAYIHEIRHAKRFGLNRIEIKGIRETMNAFYPDEERAELAPDRKMPLSF